MFSPLLLVKSKMVIGQIIRIGEKAGSILQNLQIEGAPSPGVRFIRVILQRNRFRPLNLKPDDNDATLYLIGQN